MSSSPRYAFAPAVMLMTLFVGELRAETRFKPAQLISVLFLSVAFLSALHDIRAVSRIYFKPGLPVWRSEVSLWRQNPSYKPMIWPPYMNRRWDVDLQRKES
jgi:hypothetical protein